MLPLTFILAVAALVLDGLVLVVGLDTPPPHEVASYVLLGLCLVGWPWWRHLSPRPIHTLRAIAATAGWVGLSLTWTGMVDLDSARHGYALHAYSLVVLALYAEIAGGILDRRDRGFALVPRMRWLRCRRESSRRSHARCADRSDPSAGPSADPSADPSASLPLR